MESFTFIIFIILIIIIIVQNQKLNKIERQINKFDERFFSNLSSFYKELKMIRENIKKAESSAESVVKNNSIEKEETIEVVKKAPEPIQPEISIPKEQVKSIVQSMQENKVPISIAPTLKIVVPNKPSFMERNPDLEKFIGQDLLPKIGITIFVIGMGFLVKLGIDNNVITEGMRIAIGVLCGGAMIGLAHYLRKTFAAFGSVLIGGALAVMYYTIALAFHDYGFLPQTVAFVIMVLLTAFGVLLSIAYDRKELAVLAILGGFGTPFFISTGEGNFRVLLTYILILDLGMLTLVYFKKWNIINYLTYAFSYVLFAGVFYSKFIGHESETRFSLLAFLSVFYFIFFIMTLIYNIKNKRKFEFTEIGMLISNSAIYFGLGLALLKGFKGGLYTGLFTSFIAIFNFAFAYIFFKRKDIDKNLLYLLIGLVLTFVSLIAPIQLKGNYITLFWAIEAVLLVWLAQKSGIELMKLAALIINILMLISLGMDWQLNYLPLQEYVVLPIIFNKAFLTSLVAMVSLLSSSIILKNDKEEYFYSFLKVKWLNNIVGSAFLVILYFGILLEINYQFIRAELATTHRYILIGIYNYLYLIAITLFEKIKNDEKFKQFVSILTIPVLFTYLTFYLAQTIYARNRMLNNEIEASTGYYLHYILLVLFLVIIANFYYEIYKKYTFKSQIGNIALWILALVGVYLASFEISHFTIINQYNSTVSFHKLYITVSKTVLPIVWGISALVLMLLGMRYKLKTLRIASLGLFMITLVKLFLWDLKDNTTGKIVSFILLGVILLLISFLYQKLKFIIQDDDENKK